MPDTAAQHGRSLFDGCWGNSFDYAVAESRFARGRRNGRTTGGMQPVTRPIGTSSRALECSAIGNAGTCALGESVPLHSRIGYKVSNFEPAKPEASVCRLRMDEVQHGAFDAEL